MKEFYEMDYSKQIQTLKETSELLTKTLNDLSASNYKYHLWLQAERIIRELASLIE